MFKKITYDFLKCIPVYTLNMINLKGLISCLYVRDANPTFNITASSGQTSF